MDMWSKRSHLLQPLTTLTSRKVKFKWTDVEQKPFGEIKWIFTHDILLIYPYFNERFYIHTDYSELQLGSVISQKGKPIAFYSREIKKYNSGIK